MAHADGPRPVAVTVACSPTAGEVEEVGLELEFGTTLMQAIDASGLLKKYPALASGAGSLGIWGQRAEAGTLLRDGDRVEIYRPLAVDPMEARRLRQRRQQATCNRRR